MDNLKSPASPFVNHLVSSYEDNDSHYGFTKIERASLMIAQGLCADPGMDSINVIPEMAVKIAKSVLEEANK